MLRVRFVLSWIFAGSLFGYVCGLTQQPAIAAFESLSGRWEGTQVLFQRGDCTINKGVVAPSDLRWILNVKADGAFIAEVFFDGSKTSVDKWVGKIDENFKMTFTATRKSHCSGI